WAKWPKSFGDINRELKDVAHCYNPEVGRKIINLFDSELKTKNLVQEFYAQFVYKNATSHSVGTLLDSVRQIFSHCLQPERNNNRTNGTQMGLTSMSDLDDDDFNAMMGHFDEEVEDSNRHARKSGSDQECQVDSSERLPADRFDWRDQDKVTSVKNQRQCGSCWTFAAIGALESRWLVHSGKKASENPDIDWSEQSLVNCAKKHVGTSGVIREENRPYVAEENECQTTMGQPISSYCLRSKYRYSYDAKPEELDDETIMRALVQKGPLYISFNASPLTSRNYKGGVVNDPNCPKRNNHAVLLVGYDNSDNSWIIKNSWGPYWGNQGYFKLARGSNMCGVNANIAWPNF
ncbi:hypothetical protein TYRP_020726, partial [Tyrophagus putrescentiae]